MDDPEGRGPGQSPFLVTPLASWNLQRGDRLRVTFTWDGCPGSYYGIGPAPLAADIDLWLCLDDEQSCVKQSRSYDSNIEGFDYIVPSSGGGQYTLYYGYDPGISPGCFGSGEEPAGWAWAAAPADNFFL